MDAEQVNATDHANAGTTAAAFPLTVGDAGGIHGWHEAEAKGLMRMGEAFGGSAPFEAGGIEAARSTE